MNPLVSMAVNTKYGVIDADVEQVLDNRLGIVRKEIAVSVTSPKGKKRSLIIPRGSILCRSARHRPRDHNIYSSLEETLSGLTQAYSSGAEVEAAELTGHIKVLKREFMRLQLTNLTQAQSREVAAALQYVRERLRHAENRHKVRAFQELRSVDPLSSESLVKDFDALTSGLQHADQEISLRLYQVQSIYPKLDERRIALLTLRENYHARLDALQEYLKIWYLRLLQPQALQEADLRAWKAGAEKVQSLVSPLNAMPYARIKEQFEGWAEAAAKVHRYGAEDKLRMRQLLRDASAYMRRAQWLQDLYRANERLLDLQTSTKFSSKEVKQAARYSASLFRRCRAMMDGESTEKYDHLYAKNQELFRNGLHAANRLWLKRVRDTHRQLADLLFA